MFEEDAVGTHRAWVGARAWRRAPAAAAAAAPPPAPPPAAPAHTHTVTAALLLQQLGHTLRESHPE